MRLASLEYTHYTVIMHPIRQGVTNVNRANGVDRANYLEIFLHSDDGYRR